MNDTLIIASSNGGAVQEHDTNHPPMTAPTESHVPDITTSTP